MKHSLGRSWDSFDAYLFDIDGTLLHCRDAVHYSAFNEALTRVAGVPLTIDGVTVHGNTDTGIIRDACARHGVSEAVWRPRLAEIVEIMARSVDANQGAFCIDVLPQVLNTLVRLKSRGARLGTATGNLERIGLLKLQHAGLLPFFDFAGWSDGHETRSAVFLAAAEKARDLVGAGAAICVFGDTPYDVRAARECGLNVIAVATGIYSTDLLAAEHPDGLLSTFADLP